MTFDGFCSVAVLDHHGGLYPRRVIAADVSRRGIPLLPPCVLRSSLECTIEARGGEGPARGIRIGLLLLAGLHAATSERQLRFRAVAGQFSGAQDLIHRARPSGRELRALVLSGACDALLGLETADYPWVHEALAQCLERGEGASAENTLSSRRPVHFWCACAFRSNKGVLSLAVQDLLPFHQRPGA